MVRVTEISAFLSMQKVTGVHADGQQRMKKENIKGKKKEKAEQ